MGCVSSKQATRSPPPRPVRRNASSRKTLKRELDNIPEEEDNEDGRESSLGVGSNRRRQGLKERKLTKKGSGKKAIFSFKFGRDADQIAAGWPPWLSTVASEAVDGWLPLKADSFEKLDKIGQGTYSSVYRARNLETGKIVALKKVRFDTFQPESVRFMAREIMLLRRLDHPNVMKLEGLVTNRFSCSLYLVFEYMEHDLSGLLSCPDIKFSDSQIKCYMRQLLTGLEHCHARGVMHRDLKASNILLNNEGYLKIADFGLANYISGRHRQALTSRVVTLWYRPPELLLGSTDYGPSVDLWSAGCVFAELFTGKPILKARTEVEQLHKIFKLCGTPPDDYWETSNLPLANLFKPQHPYESSLRERFKEFPKTAVNLLETFLSIEPQKRGTASSALEAEYFSTKPYACDPSSLPKYPPNKEIDARSRDEERRKKAGHRPRASETSRNPRKSRTVLPEPSSMSKEMDTNKSDNAYLPKAKGVTESRQSLKFDTVSEASQTTELSQVDSIHTTHSVPAVTSSGSFTWVKTKKGIGPARIHSVGCSRGQDLGALDSPDKSSAKHIRDTAEENEEIFDKFYIDSEVNDSYEVGNFSMSRRPLGQSYQRDSIGASEFHQTQEFLLDYDDQKIRGPSSGPLLYRPKQIDQKRETHNGASRFKDL